MLLRRRERDRVPVLPTVEALSAESVDLCSCIRRQEGQRKRMSECVFMCVYVCARVRMLAMADFWCLVLLFGLLSQISLRSAIESFFG